MRRLVSIVAVLAAAALIATGCSSDDSSGSALESTLDYVPRDSPFVVAIDTDLDDHQYRSLDAIIGKFPFGDQLEGLLKEQIEQGDEGVSFDEDVKPVLGNPFVVSAGDVSTFLGSSDDDDFVAAIEVDDRDALDHLIDRTSPHKQGEVAGATVYDDDGTWFAVDDDVVVLGGSRDLLEAALKRADGDDHLDADSFDEGLQGLPDEALARIYVDVQSLLRQDTGAAGARKVEWVNALRTLGMTASADDDSIDVKFNLRADGGDLTDADLPLAAGEEAPEIVQQRGEIGFGVRDPSQIVRFFETALQAVDPQGFGDYEKGKLSLSRQLNLDVDRDLIGQLTGDLSISVAVDGSFAAREEPKDPDAFARTVDKLAASLPRVASGLGVTDVARRGKLYEARLSDGGRFVFGVTNGVFVAASDAARARRLASQEPQAVQGAIGSLVLSADAQQVAAQLLEQLAPGLGLPPVFPVGMFARPLRDLTGSVSSSSDGMKGRFSLTLD
jgi:hypothetical protein